VSNMSLRQVFRLRKCPAEQNREWLQRVLSEALSDIRPQDIRIQSLAADADPSAETKTATLMFVTMPGLLKDSQPGQTEWRISRFLLDNHFQGMTPLNDVDPNRHTSE